MVFMEVKVDHRMPQAARNAGNSASLRLAMSSSCLEHPTATVRGRHHSVQPGLFTSLRYARSSGGGDHGWIARPAPADMPTAKLVRQVLGAEAEYEKAILVAKLMGARDRKLVALG